MSFSNPSADEICRLLHSVRRIAVLGLSTQVERPAFRVAQAMQRFGYGIIPVHPLETTVLDEPSFPDLENIPNLPDIVTVFRAPEHVPEIVESCIKLGIKNLWLQDGVVHEAAALRAQHAGMVVVMNRCMWRDYTQLCGGTI